MVIYCSCFPNLDEAMHSAGMSRRMLAEKTGIKLPTLGCKLRSESEFTRSEMFKIKKALESRGVRGLFLDELFTTGSKFSKPS